jgi:hypothetical protein
MARNHPGRKRSDLDPAHRIHQPPQTGPNRDHHIPLPSPARRSPHHPRRPPNTPTHRPPPGDGPPTSRPPGTPSAQHSDDHPITQPTKHERTTGPRKARPPSDTGPINHATTRKPPPSSATRHQTQPTSTTTKNRGYDLEIGRVNCSANVSNLLIHSTTGQFKPAGTFQPSRAQ